MFRFFIMFGFLVFVGLQPAKAQITCDPQPMAKINVTWSSDPIEYDFTKTQAQMNAIDNDTVNPYGNHKETHVGGLMLGGVGLQSGSSTRHIVYKRSNQMCMWVDSVDVKLHIDPKILITKEHKPGTCKHNAIMEHEMKHIFVDRAVVKKYVPLFRAEVQRAVQAIGVVGPKSARDVEKYRKKVGDYLNKKVTALNERMNNERGQRQQAIDTLEEYERVAAVCR